MGQSLGNVSLEKNLCILCENLCEQKKNQKDTTPTLKDEAFYKSNQKKTFFTENVHDTLHPSVSPPALMYGTL